MNTLNMMRKPIETNQMEISDVSAAQDYWGLASGIDIYLEGKDKYPKYLKLSKSITSTVN